MDEKRLLEIKNLLLTSQLPDLGPGPRADVMSDAELNRALDGLFRAVQIPFENQQLVRALLLLWHDHLDAAHVIAQEIDNADGAFVHGIMHRREPDYGNAKYWFRRVGKHPALPQIAARVGVSLGAKGGDDVFRKLVRQGEWDLFAFVDLCQEAQGSRASAEREEVLREV